RIVVDVDVIDDIRRRSEVDVARLDPEMVGEAEATKGFDSQIIGVEVEVVRAGFDVRFSDADAEIVALVHGLRGGGECDEGNREQEPGHIHSLEETAAGRHADGARPASPCGAKRTSDRSDYRRLESNQSSPPR